MHTYEYQLGREELIINEAVYSHTKEKKTTENLSIKDTVKHYAKEIDTHLELEIFEHLGFSETGEIRYPIGNKELANPISVLKAAVKHTFKLAE